MSVQWDDWHKRPEEKPPVLSWAVAFVVSIGLWWSFWWAFFRYVVPFFQKLQLM